MENEVLVNQMQIKIMLIQVVSLIKMLLSFVRFQMRKTMGYFTRLSCFSSTEAMNLEWNLWPSFLEACKFISIYPVMTKIFTEIKVQIFYGFYMYLCYPTPSGQRHIQIQLLGLESIYNKRIKIYYQYILGRLMGIVLSFPTYSSLSSDVLSNHTSVIPKCTEASLDWWDLM